MARDYTIRVGGTEEQVSSSCVINAAKKFSARHELTKGTRLQVYDNKHRAWVGFRVENHPRVLSRLGVVSRE